MRWPWSRPTEADLWALAEEACERIADGLRAHDPAASGWTIAQAIGEREGLKIEELARLVAYMNEVADAFMLQRLAEAEPMGTA